MKCNKHCPHCGIERFEKNEVCHYCGYNFENNTIDNNYTESSIYSNENIKKSISSNKSKEMGCLGHFIFFVFVGPILLLGLLLLIIGVGFSIYQKNALKDFRSIEATLYEYYDCKIEFNEYKDVETCNARYVFYVGDREYFVSSSYAAEKEEFSTLETIYYNPNNPDESGIFSDLSLFTFIGSILVIVGLTIYVITRTIVRRTKKTT